MQAGSTLLVFAVLVLGAALILLRSVRVVASEVAEDRVLLARMKAAVGEIYRVEAARQSLEGYTRFAEGGVGAGGAVGGINSVVRDSHMAISSIPFEILAAIPATRDTSKVVREVHDTISGGVYGSISAVNKMIGRSLRPGDVREPRNPS